MSAPPPQRPRVNVVMQQPPRPGMLPTVAAAGRGMPPPAGRVGAGGFAVPRPMVPPSLRVPGAPVQQQPPPNAVASHSSIESNRERQIEFIERKKRRHSALETANVRVHEAAVRVRRIEKAGDQKLTELSESQKFLGELTSNEYSPTIPDSVVQFHLKKAGCDVQDPAVLRLVGLGAQSFLVRTLHDAHTASKHRIRADTSKKQLKPDISTDDLLKSLLESGVRVKRPKLMFVNSE